MTSLSWCPFKFKINSKLLRMNYKVFHVMNLPIHQAHPQPLCYPHTGTPAWYPATKLNYSCFLPSCLEHAFLSTRKFFYATPQATASIQPSQFCGGTTCQIFQRQVVIPSSTLTWEFQFKAFVLHSLLRVFMCCLSVSGDNEIFKVTKQDLFIFIYPNLSWYWQESECATPNYDAVAWGLFRAQGIFYVGN